MYQNKSTRLYKLKLYRDMKKDYYVSFPSVYCLFQIQQLATEIRALRR